MITKFSGKRISGILSILPENEYDFDEETKDIATSKTRRLKKVMGYNKRRAAKADSVTTDFCKYGLQYILENGYLNKEDIGAIIVVGLTPDYYVPHMSNIIQGEFQLSSDIICLDIQQGCAGYIVGLLEAFMLLERIGNKKALVFTGDVLNRQDRCVKLSEPSFGGDAASISVVENVNNIRDIYMNLYMDGTRREALVMHAGGYRMPRCEKTAVPVDMGDGIKKPYDQIWMDGSGVFNFVQKEVPPMLEEILDYSGMKIENIEWFLFHQPNKFMLQKLADKVGIPYEKIPMNVVENFGNSSGSTIPVNITYNLGKDLLDHVYTCCLSGFGSGLSWGGAIMELGKLDFCETIISPF